jgi:electron transfer flavoprotein beta subunit
MRIIICVKQVQFTYARTGRDLINNYILPEDNIFRINPYDEAALDIALGLKEKDESTEVMILTLGPVIAEKELRRCIALGADAVYRIDSEEEYDSWSKAQLLAQAIRGLKADLILCGKESVDKQNGQVGAFIAHHLKLPFISDVIHLETGFIGRRLTAMVGQEPVFYGTTCQAIRSAGKGVREEVEFKAPALLIISQTDVSAQLPSYEERQKALTTPFRIIDVDTKQAVKKVVHKITFPPRPRPKKVRTPDSNLPAFERINQLLAGSSVEKKGAMLAGDTASLVEGIISYLTEKGFLEIKNTSPSKKA